MKDELTELMHSEFTISPEMEICNKVGAAITVFKMSKNKDLNRILESYGITIDDYNKWKDHWLNLE